MEAFVNVVLILLQKTKQRKERVSREKKETPNPKPTHS
jgi:hypothetical protein